MPKQNYNCTFNLPGQKEFDLDINKIKSVKILKSVGGQNGTKWFLRILTSKDKIGLESNDPASAFALLEALRNQIRDHLERLSIVYKKNLTGKYQSLLMALEAQLRKDIAGLQ